MRLPFTKEQFLDLFAAYNVALWPFVLGRWFASALAAHWAWTAHQPRCVGVRGDVPAAGGLFVWYGVIRSGLSFVPWGTAWAPVLLLARPRRLSLAAVPVVWSMTGGSAAFLLDGRADYALPLAGLALAAFSTTGRGRPVSGTSQGDMIAPSRGPRGASLLARAAGVAAAAYAAYVGIAWSRYGRSPLRAPSRAEADSLLDHFMPVYEVRTRHRIRIAAPAATTLAAAQEMNLLRSPGVRAIIRARELILGASPDPRPRPERLLAEVQALGWGVLADVPGREVVVGAATQPWKGDVVFRSVPTEQFAAFDDPGYVKIAWTLRADPVGPHESIFSTETRAASTDAATRARFRWYWSCFSPGMILIRWLSLRPLKRDAENRAREEGRP